jgi:regulator of replication initiation timing
MNTLRTIFEKLSKEETQLASHKVELATVKEVDGKLKSFGLPFSEINKVSSLINTVQSNLRNLEKSINETIQEAKQIEIKAKELGIDAGLETALKYANEKLKQTAAANSLFSRFNSEIEKLK